jgi:hypothetical protein
MKKYTFAVLDPRNNPVAIEANEKVFAEGSVMGIEVTIPALAEKCLLGNVDPQHGNHRETYDNGSGYMEATSSCFVPGESAIEFVFRQIELQNESSKKGMWMGVMIPPEGSTLATIRPDLDSVGAMALLNILKNAEADAISGSYEHLLGCNPKGWKPSGEFMKRVQMIATADKFARGEYAGPRSLPTEENPWCEGTSTAESSRPLAAIAAAIADFKVPFTQRVEWMENWLLYGNEPGSYRPQVECERAGMIAALEMGIIKHEVRAGGKLAVVVSTHRSITEIGYSLAPVIVALNPEFRFGSGEPHAKFTICQYSTGYVDLKSVFAELSALEASWGGSPTIGGSRQGVNSTLTIDQVVEVVSKYLLK